MPMHGPLLCRGPRGWPAVVVGGEGCGEQDRPHGEYAENCDGPVERADDADRRAHAETIGASVRLMI